MQISHGDARSADAVELPRLSAWMQWDSTNYPDKLFQAIKNSCRVITAWDGERLVGLMNVILDGVMTTYFHHLLVRPEYPGQGIGRTLVKQKLAQCACSRRLQRSSGAET